MVELESKVTTSLLSPKVSLTVCPKNNGVNPFNWFTVVKNVEKSAHTVARSSIYLNFHTLKTWRVSVKVPKLSIDTFLFICGLPLWLCIDTAEVTSTLYILVQERSLAATLVCHPR